MPVSVAEGLEETVAYVTRHFPRSTRILDVGAGTGTYGKLLRPLGYTLDALEASERSVAEFGLQDVYREVTVGDVRSAVFTQHDLVLLGGVIEHLTPVEAVTVIERARARAEVIVSVTWRCRSEWSANPHETYLQSDLTPEVVKTRYPTLDPIHVGAKVGIYTTGRPALKVPTTEVDLTVLVLSCRRVPLLRKTMEAAKRHFDTVEADVRTRWVCFDNGSEPDDQAELRGMGFDLLLLSRRNLGQGPALNQLVASVRTDHFLLLEDDWVIENPLGRPFVSEALRILRTDPRLGQVKVDGAYHLEFGDRSLYDGPFRVRGGEASFYVQNPTQQWGGFCCPPAITKTSTMHATGPFEESQPFRRWFAESEFSARYARRFLVAKSPELALFKHIGDEPSPGWRDSGQGGCLSDVAATSSSSPRGDRVPR